VERAGAHVSAFSFLIELADLQGRAKLGGRPVHAEAEAAWRLNSWDRFCVPKPFSRIRVAYGRPFGVESGAAGRGAGRGRRHDEVTRSNGPAGGATPIG
jgi:lysophospholipid acyltransferase (LPLAT)-like uncharacterized protein